MTVHYSLSHQAEMIADDHAGLHASRTWSKLATSRQDSAQALLEAQWPSNQTAGAEVKHWSQAMACCSLTKNLQTSSLWQICS